MEKIAFTLTEDHLKLSKRLFVEWSDMAYQGYPFINPKRPYGNGDIMGDIAETIGWAVDEENGLNDLQLKVAEEYHRDMKNVLQIILCTQSFIPGLYARTDEYDALSWKLLTAHH